MKRIFLAIFCFLLILIAVSCANNDDEKNTGVRVNDDVLSSIRQEIEERENYLLAEEGDVFWTPSGTIWHATYECSYLSNAKTIYHGTVESAMLEGKERACGSCFATEEDKIYSNLEDNEIKQDDVFFTRESDVWHSDINCTLLLGEDTVYNASKKVAKELGKINPCDECTNNK